MTFDITQKDISYLKKEHIASIVIDKDFDKNVLKVNLDNIKAADTNKYNDVFGLFKYCDSILRETHAKDIKSIQNKLATIGKSANHFSEINITVNNFNDEIRKCIDNEVKFSIPRLMYNVDGKKADEFENYLKLISCRNSNCGHDASWDKFFEAELNQLYLLSDVNNEGNQTTSIFGSSNDNRSALEKLHSTQTKFSDYFSDEGNKAHYLNQFFNYLKKSGNQHKNLNPLKVTNDKEFLKQLSTHLENGSPFPFTHIILDLSNNDLDDAAVESIQSIILKSKNIKKIDLYSSEKNLSKLTTAFKGLAENHQDGLKNVTTKVFCHYQKPNNNNEENDFKTQYFRVANQIADNLRKVACGDFKAKDEVKIEAKKTETKTEDSEEQKVSHQVVMACKVNSTNLMDGLIEANNQQQAQGERQAESSQHTEMRTQSQSQAQAAYSGAEDSLIDCDKFARKYPDFFGKMANDAGNNEDKKAIQDLHNTDRVNAIKYNHGKWLWYKMFGGVSSFYSGTEKFESSYSQGQKNRISYIDDIEILKYWPSLVDGINIDNLPEGLNCKWYDDNKDSSRSGWVLTQGKNENKNKSVLTTEARALPTRKELADDFWYGSLAQFTKKQDDFSNDKFNDIISTSHNKSWDGKEYISLSNPSAYSYAKFDENGSNEKLNIDTLNEWYQAMSQPSTSIESKYSEFFKLAQTKKDDKIFQSAIFELMDVLQKFGPQGVDLVLANLNKLCSIKFNDGKKDKNLGEQFIRIFVARNFVDNKNYAPRFAAGKTIKDLENLSQPIDEFIKEFSDAKNENQIEKLKFILTLSEREQELWQYVDFNAAWKKFQHFFSELQKIGFTLPKDAAEVNNPEKTYWSTKGKEDTSEETPTPVVRNISVVLERYLDFISRVSKEKLSEQKEYLNFNQNFLDKEGAWSALHNQSDKDHRVIEGFKFYHPDMQLTPNKIFNKSETSYRVSIREWQEYLQKTSSFDNYKNNVILFHRFLGCTDRATYAQYQDYVKLIKQLNDLKNDPNDKNHYDKMEWDQLKITLLPILALVTTGDRKQPLNENIKALTTLFDTLEKPFVFSPFLPDEKPNNVTMKEGTKEILSTLAQEIDKFDVTPTLDEINALVKVIIDSKQASDCKKYIKLFQAEDSAKALAIWNNNPQHLAPKDFLFAAQLGDGNTKLCDDLNDAKQLHSEWVKLIANCHFNNANNIQQHINQLFESVKTFPKEQREDLFKVMRYLNSHKEQPNQIFSFDVLNNVFGKLKNTKSKNYSDLAKVIKEAFKSSFSFEDSAFNAVLNSKIAGCPDSNKVIDEKLRKKWGNDARFNECIDKCRSNIKLCFDDKQSASILEAIHQQYELLQPKLFAEIWNNKSSKAYDAAKQAEIIKEIIFLAKKDIEVQDKQNSSEKIKSKGFNIEQKVCLLKATMAGKLADNKALNDFKQLLDTKDAANTRNALIKLSEVIFPNKFQQLSTLIKDQDNAEAVSIIINRLQNHPELYQQFINVLPTDNNQKATFLKIVAYSCCEKDEDFKKAKQQDFLKTINEKLNHDPVNLKNLYEQPLKPSFDRLNEYLSLQEPQKKQQFVNDFQFDPSGKRSKIVNGKTNFDTWLDLEKAEIAKRIEAIETFDNNGKKIHLTLSQRKALLNDLSYVNSVAQERALLMPSNPNYKKPACKLTQQEIKDLISEYRNRIRNKDTSAEQRKLINLEFIALVREATYRTRNGAFPYPIQILAILTDLMRGGNSLTKINTGEGKGIITTFLAAQQWAEGKTVDVRTSNVALAYRDYLEAKELFDYLGIQVAHITKDSLRNEYQKEGVNFAENSQLDLFKEREMLKFDDFVDTNNLAELIDEGDAATIDHHSLNRYSINLKGKIDNPYEWAYEVILDFVESKEFKNKELTFEDAIIKASREFAKQQKNLTDAQKEEFKGLPYKQLKVWINSAATADRLQQDKDYIIVENYADKDGEERPTKKIKIKINNRVSEGTVLGKGVQQFLCVKHNRIDKTNGITSKLFEVEPETSTLLSRSAKNSLMAGIIKLITGSSGEGEELDLLQKHYGLHFTSIPSRQESKLTTHDPELALPNKDKTPQDAYFEALFAQIKKNNRQPQLIILKDESVEYKGKNTHIVEAFEEYLKAKLDGKEKERVQSYVVSSKSVANEQAIIDAAGQDNKITIATAALGRGTDIKANNLAVVLGYVADTRNQIQIFGRTARDGKTGDAYQIISTEEFTSKAEQEKIKQYQGSNTTQEEKKKILTELIQTKQTALNNQNIKSYLRIEYAAHIRAQFVKKYLAIGKASSKLTETEQKNITELWVAFNQQFDASWDDILRDYDLAANTSQKLEDTLGNTIESLLIKANTIWKTTFNAMNDVCKKAQSSLSNDLGAGINEDDAQIKSLATSIEGELYESTNREATLANQYVNINEAAAYCDRVRALKLEVPQDKLDVIKSKALEGELSFVNSKLDGDKKNDADPKPVATATNNNAVTNVVQVNIAPEKTFATLIQQLKQSDDKLNANAVKLCNKFLTAIENYGTEDNKNKIKAAFKAHLEKEEKNSNSEYLINIFYALRKTPLINDEIQQRLNSKSSYDDFNKQIVNINESFGKLGIGVAAIADDQLSQLGEEKEISVNQSALIFNNEANSKNETKAEVKLEGNHEANVNDKEIAVKLVSNKEIAFKNVYPQLLHKLHYLKSLILANKRQQNKEQPNNQSNNTLNNNPTTEQLNHAQKVVDDIIKLKKQVWLFSKSQQKQLEQQQPQQPVNVELVSKSNAATTNDTASTASITSTSAANTGISSTTQIEGQPKINIIETIQPQQSSDDIVNVNKLQLQENLQVLQFHNYLQTRELDRRNYGPDYESIKEKLNPETGKELTANEKIEQARKKELILSACYVIERWAKDANCENKYISKIAIEDQKLVITLRGKDGEIGASNENSAKDQDCIKIDMKFLDANKPYFTCEVSQSKEFNATFKKRQEEAAAEAERKKKEAEEEKEKEKEKAKKRVEEKKITEETGKENTTSSPISNKATIEKKEEEKGSGQEQKATTETKIRKASQEGSQEKEEEEKTNKVQERQDNTNSPNNSTVVVEDIRDDDSDTFPRLCKEHFKWYVTQKALPNVSSKDLDIKSYASRDGKTIYHVITFPEGMTQDQRDEFIKQVLNSANKIAGSERFKPVAAEKTKEITKQVSDDNSAYTKIDPKDARLHFPQAPQAQQRQARRSQFDKMDSTEKKDNKHLESNKDKNAQTVTTIANNSLPEMKN